MHFLDATRFDAMISLIQSNQAYSVILDPDTLRPIINFTDVSALLWQLPFSLFI